MKIRSALLASAAVLMAGPALAADLPARTSPAPYIASAPVFNWTGFYMGLNAGAGFNQNSGGVSSNITNTIYGGTGGNTSGFTGGGQLGYNMQLGSFVAGLEADINYLDRGKGSSGTFPAVVTEVSNTDFRVSRGDGNNWFGTLRARYGYVFDRALIYATGGLAYGGKRGGVGVDQRDYVGSTGVTTLTSLSGSGNSNNVGWALGGGLEWALTNTWSVRAEYLHVDLGKNDRSFTTLASNTINVSNNNKFDVVRAGLNWRF